MNQWNERTDARARGPASSSRSERRIGNPSARTRVSRRRTSSLTTRSTVAAERGDTAQRHAARPPLSAGARVSQSTTGTQHRRRRARGRRSTARSTATAERWGVVQQRAAPPPLSGGMFDPFGDVVRRRSYPLPWEVGGTARDKCGGGWWSTAPIAIAHPKPLFARHFGKHFDERGRRHFKATAVGVISSIRLDPRLQW